MTYRVTSTWIGNKDLEGYSFKNTVESFREMVEMGLTQPDFLECVNDQNVVGWADLKDIVFSVLLSDPVEESLDTENQIYNRVCDWPTKEAYNNWVYTKNYLLSDNPEDYKGIILSSVYLEKISETGEEI
jgi:hypothetical protein